MFDDFFKRATGRQPYPYQRAFAEDGELPELLNVPTGVGKTTTAILGWLYRLCMKSESIPRRLVYCLPMRTLVEQARDCARNWLKQHSQCAPTVQSGESLRLRQLSTKAHPQCNGISL